MKWGNKGRERAACPDSGLLYSVDDVARLARVAKPTVIRLCLEGLMPEWLEIDGRKYWDRAGAFEAIARASRPPETRDAA